MRTKILITTAIVAGVVLFFSSMPSGLKSQKKSFKWAEFNKYLEKYPLPIPRIVHRFYAPRKLGEFY